MPKPKQVYVCKKCLAIVKDAIEIPEIDLVCCSKCGSLSLQKVVLEKGRKLA